MIIEVDKLTRVLAGRLAAIVPDGFHVEAADGMLWHSAGGGRFPGQTGDYQVGRGGTCVRVHVEGGGQAADDALAGVAAIALDELQDYACEATRDPWPARHGTPPRPYARVRAMIAGCCDVPGTSL